MSSTILIHVRLKLFKRCYVMYLYISCWTPLFALHSYCFPFTRTPYLSPFPIPKMNRERKTKGNSKSTMTTPSCGVGLSGFARPLTLGFAKLQGEDFEYFMQKYSIILGRNSSNSSVDVDLASLGGGMTVSRNHARIYYDFTSKCFALEVIGRAGCTVKNVLYLPGSAPIKLNSQDLLQIGKKRFYFLLPARSIFETLAAVMQIAPSLSPPLVLVPFLSSNDEMKGEDGGVSVESLIDEKFKVREAEGLPGMLCGGMEPSTIVDKNLEPGSKSAKEADSQAASPDVHVFKTDIPGIKKEQIKLEVDGRGIWIEINAEHTSENDEKTDKYLWRFVLPENAKMDQIKATMENSVLTVTMPKGEAKEPWMLGSKSIEISD